MLKTLFALLLLFASIEIDARQVRRQPTRRTARCSTNAECLQKGLPIIPPRTPGHRYRRQDPSQGFIPVVSETCGSSETVLLFPGRYQVSLSGAAGGASIDPYGHVFRLPGRGAALTATLDVVRNTTVGYFVGCEGRQRGPLGGGGGGTFLFIPGHMQPAILVAGAGGGAAPFYGTPGQNAPASFDGRATNGDGTPGSQGGAGGTNNGNSQSGAGGGGFVSAGASAFIGDEPATGGSQSTNYGGTFAGGFSGFVSAGGEGGGGAAGGDGGGGGGGYSGGGGGITLSSRSTTGGGAGGSYANPDTPGGITVTPLTIAATSVGMGSLTITKV